MTNPWPTVRLGEVLRRVERFEPREEFTEYQFAGTYSFARGIFVGERKLGSSFALPRIQRIRAGDFIYCKIMAWEGAFGIALKETDNCVMSGAFVVYELNRERIDEKFLDYFFKVPDHWQSIGSQSTGTNVRRQSLHPNQFEKAEIPLPPLAEQRRVVARIEGLAAQIHEARTLRHQAAEEAEALTHSTTSKLAFETTWEMRRLPDVTEINPSRAGNVKLEPSDKVSFVPMKAVDDVTGTIAWPETKEFHEVAKGYTWFENGDVIFARITPCMQNGKAALAKNLVSSVGFGSTEFHVIRPGKDVCAEWIYYLVRHKAFRNDAAEHFKGTAGQQRVPQSFLDQKLIPVPALPEQRRIVSELDALQAVVDVLKRLQAETAQELDALLPSILDRAFKGEL